MLRPLAENLWDLDAPMSILGMALGHRMTIVRLPDGTLWLHSPVAYSAELATALARLGPVAHLVAPNCMHDTYLEGWFAACPAARFHGAPGFTRHPIPSRPRHRSRGLASSISTSSAECRASMKSLSSIALRVR
jgi:hypothetical protein